MILVTLGTQDKSFDRLLRAVDREIKNNNIKEKVVVQAGYTKYKSKNMEIFDLTTPEEIDGLMKEARIVITHGGVGSILNALKYDKPVIAAARLSRYKEHTNDHQKQIIAEFVKYGYLIELDNFSKLNEVLKEAEVFKPKKYKSNNKKFVKNITTYIEEDNHVSWYNKYRILCNILFLILLVGIIILLLV